MSLACAVAGCGSAKHGQSKKLPGTWQTEPITIDGSNKDWPSPYPDYDAKAQLGYAVSNDKYNLYITVETGDPATQLKIMRSGLSVWIDKTGEKEETTAINFPIPSEREEGSKEDKQKPAGGQWQSSSPDKQRMELEDKVSMALQQANEFSLQGFKACNLQYPLMEKDSCGVMVRMAIDADHELIWEAVIPFRSFYSKRELDRRDKGKPMSICIETVGMKRPPGQSGGQHSNGGGMRPGIGIGGMGMGVQMGGGGMRRGNGTGNQGGATNMMEPAYKSTVTWKKFGLAFQ